jgi:hypothetical protein
MSIEGRIAIDVSFSDSTTSSGVQSLKKLSLGDTTSYTTGKVAIVTGTCGTTSDNVAISPSSYRDSAGNLVTFASVNRIAFAANPQSKCFPTGQDELLVSSSNRVAVTDIQNAVVFEVARIGTAGTASYTLVLYGT